MIMQLYLEMAVFVATPFSHTLAQNKILPLFHPKSKHKKKKVISGLGAFQTTAHTNVCISVVWATVHS